MKYNVLYLLLLLFLAGCFGAKKQAAITSNPPPENDETTTSSQVVFETRKMAVNHRVFDNDASLRIFLELDIPRLEKEANIEQIRQTFIINYGILPNYSSKEFTDLQKVDLTATDIRFGNGKYYMSFDIQKKPVISSVLVVDIVDTQNGQKVIHDLLVNYTIIRDRERYGMFDGNGKLPLFSSYLLNKDTIQVRSLTGAESGLTVTYYDQEFKPAIPPMATNIATVPRILSPDSVFAIRTNQSYNFKKPGLYLVRSDTTSYYGLSFFVASRKYPKLSKIHDLIDPLIYITTKEELDELENAEELKKTMDKFWLKLMSGNVKKAKYTIRQYYQRVRQANDFFTTYKPGWQTDMGMILIIYGNPNKIIRNNDQEFWIYTQTASFAEIKFEFLRKPNQFTDYNFVLKRYPDYEQVWYPAIELWREGKVQ